MIFILRVDVVCFVGRPRKAGPPPERKMEGSIDVIGGEGSRGTCTPSLPFNYFAFFFYPFLGALHSIQGGVEILLVASCYTNLGMLWSDGPLGLYADLTLGHTIAVDI